MTYVHTIERKKGKTVKERVVFEHGALYCAVELSPSPRVLIGPTLASMGTGRPFKSPDTTVGAAWAVATSFLRGW